MGIGIFFPQGPAGQDAVAAAAGFDDRLVEESLRSRNGQQGLHGYAPRRFPEDRDVVWIATEGGDVVPDPLQGGNLVEVGVAAGGLLPGFFAQCRESKMAEATQAVVKGHQHDPLPGKRFSRHGSIGATAEDEGTAVDPDHHRQVRFRLGT